MKRLPNEADLLTSIDFSRSELDRIKIHVGDLLRRRMYDAGRDGYPSSSLGGNGSTSSMSSSTESSALSSPMVDPIARYIDEILNALKTVDGEMVRVAACLSNVLTSEEENRGRQSSIIECDACSATITGIGDDRRRAGLCPACFKAWIRWRSTVSEPSRVVFIAQRRQKLSSKVPA